MRRWFQIWIMLFPFLVRADQLADKLSLEGVKQFNAAYQAWDGSQFAAAAELFRRASSNAPSSSTIFYWLGTAHFHHMLQLQYQPAARSNTLASAAAMDAALNALERAVQLNARDAESHALLGTLYGMKIDGNLVRGARFGPRVEQHSKQAMALGAQTARAQYLLGTCQFHTAHKPAKLREALATLLAAERLFLEEAKIPAAPLEPRWGYDSCLTFIGRTYEQLGEPAKAAEYYRKALAAHPADHLAKEGLARVVQGK